MLDFYTSWSHSDPFYSRYVPDSKILLSIPHVSRSFNISKFTKMPQKIMIDSGAYSLLSRPSQEINQTYVFNQQLNVSRGSTIPTSLCHLDFPIPPNMHDRIEINRRIDATIANAYEFMQLFRAANLPPNYKSVGVIQGIDYETISFCARELSRIGFSQLGIGSLALLNHKEVILERVKYAVDVVGPDVHVFGISGIKITRELMKLGIHSLDSSRPIKVAMYGCLLYSKPFQTYKINESKVDKNMPTIDSPIPCDCPVCQQDPYLIFKSNGRKYKNLRAVHNYYHLKTELESIYYDL